MVLVTFGTLTLIGAFSLMSQTGMVSGQIPYSYSSGRDLGAVKRRSEAFATAKASGASPEELQRICGPLVVIPPICTNNVGRSSDSETQMCDVSCCLQGHKTGNCGRSGCNCVDDDTDVRCGPDGSFAGIRCPDNSACWRKCCRRGSPGGHCGGFLKTKCKCD